MSREYDHCENRNRYCVPIEQPHIPTRFEVGEKSDREITLGVEWNAARNIARSGAKQDR